MMVHQRVGAVDQQQVNPVCAKGRQRGVDRGDDVIARGVVVFYPPVRIATDRRDDVAFCHNLDLVTQGRSQGCAQDRLGRVTAVDVGLIQRCDALVEASVDLGAHGFRRRILDITDPPHAVDNARKAEVGGDLNAVHQWRSPAPSGVIGVAEGTRP